MELLEGGNFRDLIVNQIKRESVDDAMLFSYIDQFTAAVANMHKVGVLHRDLKPENLVLTKDLEQIKIIDFGIAVDTKLDLTKDDLKQKFTTQAGTDMWQSPELREPVRRGYTVKADFYSCGLLMQFTVTGREPYERIRDWATCAIPERTGHPSSFTYLIWPIMAKCIQAREEDRPANIGEIRRVVHANLLWAAKKSNNPQAAIDCVERNEDFDVNFLHSDFDNFSSLHMAAMCESLKLTEALI